MITVITEANYTATTGETLGLAPGEVAAYGVRGDTLTIRWTVDAVGTELGESSFPIAKHLSRNPAFDPQITELVTIVVPDDAAINDIWAKQAEVYPDDYSSMRWLSYLDVNAAEEELEELQTRYYDAIEDGSFYEGTGSWKRCIWNLRSEGARYSFRHSPFPCLHRSFRCGFAGMAMLPYQGRRKAALPGLRRHVSAPDIFGAGPLGQ